ncbi:amiloride-sensitive amine oxidase [copper-containing]-like [Mercenaria mercenaria]|uniref:amiloride-sensitive amine oxidase [copper-containing]-like n=1 Tax=Mercenaria mercenaria TaxID=6596 RepID=UPI00234E42ED|nr:amiloride-sensitive amine oxidase [copper-containing]-like [Mercenaria mercenaria]
MSMSADSLKVSGATAGNEEHGAGKNKRNLNIPSLGNQPDDDMEMSPLTVEKNTVEKTAQNDKRKLHRKVYIVNVVLLTSVVVLLVIVIYLATVKQPSQRCNYADSDYVKPRNWKDPEPHDDLSPEEFSAVRNFMIKTKSLGITPFEEATVNSSYILTIDLFLPRKAEVIEYLDRGGRKPQRKALVVVIRGDTEPPKIEEYIVSPLPTPTTAEPYRNPSYKQFPIPFTSRPMDDVNYIPFYNVVIYDAMEQMYPLLIESYGRGYHNCTTKANCLIPFDTAPRGRKSGDRKTWVWLFAAEDGFYIHPLGLEFFIDHKSTDTSEWHVEMVVYNGRKFIGIDALMEAYNTNTLNLIHRKDKNSKYSSYAARGDISKQPLQGPRLFEPDGKRYSINGQHVTYGQWSFHYSMRASTGLQIFDVKFDDERLAYEISLQEVLVMYTGYGPTQSNTDYYDVSWFLGATNMELIRGIDCPETAIFLDTYFFANSASVQKYKSNVCVFETNGAIPLRRHYSNNFDGGYTFYGGIADYHLVIRTVANVWNYDYIFDYIFYNNGAIEVKSSATGYVQATFRLPEEEKYGGIIHEQVMADLHSHIFTYKVDLDIAGIENRYTTLDVGLETVKDPWFETYNRTQMKITKHLISKETKEQTFKDGVPQYLLIHNKDGNNKFGSSRTYRILNKAPNPFLVRDLELANACKFARYPVIVTKRKDTEQTASTIYAQHEPWNPVLDFNDFINDENLIDEDLVAWVTTGTHHIPGTEDLPSTPTTWNQFSFFLTPHDFFDESPSVRSSDNVVIRPDSNGKPVIHTYGRLFESKCIPQTVGPYTFDGRRG